MPSYYSTQKWRTTRPLLMFSGDQDGDAPTDGIEVLE
jgi:hypothetical protein